MRRSITHWYSTRVYKHMPIVSYGHAGHPLLILPTDEADFLECERFELIETLAPFIEAGQVRVYCVNSVNHSGLLNPQAEPALKIEYVARYDSYLVHEVLPFIRHDSSNMDELPLIAGISLGASLASNTFFKHPDLFLGTLLFSGRYDLSDYLPGYYSNELYFNNPVDFLPNLADDYYYPILARGDRHIILFSGQGTYESPQCAQRLSSILHQKGIAHCLDLWGHDVTHDWLWWRKAMRYHVGKLCSQEGYGPSYLLNHAQS